MKVLLVNGSPHREGCTNRALTEVADTLRQEDVEAELFWLGNQPISGCLDCGRCGTLKKCVIQDKVNEFVALAREADAFVFGTPVHYASASGAITAFMDRVFFSEGVGNGGQAFYLKPAACVVSARRAGTTASLDQLNKYLTISQMPVVSSRYWNMVFGNTPQEVEQDKEGLYTMRVLARNMAFLLKCQQAGRSAGVALPRQETPHQTNFIRP